LIWRETLPHQPSRCENKRKQTPHKKRRTRNAVQQTPDKKRKTRNYTQETQPKRTQPKEMSLKQSINAAQSQRNPNPSSSRLDAGRTNCLLGLLRTRDLHSASGTRVDGTHLDILLLTLPTCMVPSSPTSLRIPDDSAAAEEKEKNIKNKAAKRQPNRDHRRVSVPVDRLKGEGHCNTLAGGTKHCTGGTVGCGENRLIDDLGNFVCLAIGIMVLRLRWTTSFFLSKEPGQRFPWCSLKVHTLVILDS
jgi:hypothetical protein